jgi:hypothetical protein
MRQIGCPTLHWGWICVWLGYNMFNRCYRCAHWRQNDNMVSMVLESSPIRNQPSPSGIQTFSPSTRAWLSPSSTCTSDEWLRCRIWIPIFFSLTRVSLPSVFLQVFRIPFHVFRIPFNHVSAFSMKHPECKHEQSVWAGIMVVRLVVVRLSQISAWIMVAHLSQVVNEYEELLRRKQNVPRFSYGMTVVRWFFLTYLFCDASSQSRTVPLNTDHL